MKRMIIAAALALAVCGSGKADSLYGIVADADGNPVEYATVVALSGEEQRGGTVTDSLGHYAMSLPAGEFRISCSSVGCEPLATDVKIKGNTELNLTMQATGVQMNEIEVRASAIRREPDRFVMMVEDMPAAIGKDGKELLREAPGVWIDDDKISINGKGGTKVYVNDRELKMGNDQLQAFLKSLKAEDVSKVEVIPQSGAEYSADSSAGIIKITMKKSRTDGVMGNVGLSSTFGKREAWLNPSLSLNVKKGKWSFNLNGSMETALSMSRDLQEWTDYATGSRYSTNTRMDADGMLSGNVLAGIFFDLNDRNSFGLEVNYFHLKNPYISLTNARFDRPDRTELLQGRYDTRSHDQNVDATFNYVNRLDSLGSTLKFIANYSRSDGDQNMDNSRKSIIGSIMTDSISRSDENTVYDVANLSFDFDKKFRHDWGFSSGVKYTFNKMNSVAFYEYLKNEAWKTEAERNYNERYTENIFAAYAKASAKFGKLSAVAGLRVEYTKGSSRGNIVEQDYFDWFPNANLTYSFDGQGANSLTASYSRYISRPNFWSLNPVRRQTSDNTYQSGNPYLRPAYSNNLSLTAVYKYRYSLSVWMEITQNTMMQGAISDPKYPEDVLIGMVSGDSKKGMGAALSLPFQLTKWWSLNANVTYLYYAERMAESEPMAHRNLAFVMLNTGFQLPKDFYISASYFHRTKVKQGMIEVDPFNILNISVKKSFSNKRWTAAVGAYNVLGQSIKFKMFSSGYANRASNENPVLFDVSLTYNFNAGKMFQAKSIEKNADASRMQKDSGGVGK